MLDFLFKKKKKTTEENKKEEVKETKITKEEPKKEVKDSKKKLTIEERVEKEFAALPAIIRNKISKDPTIKQKFIKIAKMMEADGVDMDNPKAMKKWLKDHEKSLREKEVGKVETVVKGETVGRNDPCPCGSGKKYKKCCGK